MRSRIAIFAALGGALVLQACASMGEDECKLADWRGIGIEDGSRGATTASFTKRRQACAKHGVQADMQAYLQGRSQGLRQYCRPQNGYSQGASGRRYNGVCPPELERGFIEAHAQGWGLYERKRTVHRLKKKLHSAEHRAKQIEHLLAEKTAALVMTRGNVQQRASLAIELKQLTQEKIEVERDLPVIERDHAAAVDEYDRYRASLGRN